MKIKSMPELERPVEKCLANGIESLSNDELLALLINTGTKEKSAKDLAAEVLAKDRAGLMYLRESSVDELMTVNGIGAAKAARIMAAVELGKRLSARPVPLRRAKSALRFPGPAGKRSALISPCARICALSPCRRGCGAAPY